MRLKRSVVSGVRIAEFGLRIADWTSFGHGRLQLGETFNSAVRGGRVEFNSGRTKSHQVAPSPTKNPRESHRIKVNQTGLRSGLVRPGQAASVSAKGRVAQIEKIKTSSVGRLRLIVKPRNRCRCGPCCGSQTRGPGRGIYVASAIARKFAREISKASPIV